MRNLSSSWQRGVCVIGLALGVVALGMVVSGCGVDADRDDGSFDKTNGPLGHADGATSPQDVRAAALATYIHGMTETIALREVGLAGRGTLLALLADADFERRDNVVAMLGFVADDAVVADLLDHLRQPAAPLSRPEEDRAMLLVPEALGHAAARGNARALNVLLQVTAHGSMGGVLRRGASHSAAPIAMLTDLLSSAIVGLANAGTPEALARLGDLGAGRVVPLPLAGTRLGVHAARVQQRHVAGPAASTAGKPVSLDGAEDVPEAAGGLATIKAALLDSQSRVHDAPLTFANHPAVTNPMTDAQLDTALDLATLRAGRAEFSADVACCTTATRSGTARTFGFVGDGLDLIGTESELLAVLNDSISRVKVVRNISWCGSPGTNIIGCAWVGGNGMALVRMSDLGSESVLWFHEYGHNTGLSHNPDSRYVMHGIDYGTNHALTQTECNTYHSPTAGAAMSVVDSGACLDGDSDDVHDGIDNCPTVANNDQTDTDDNGVGDACEFAGECGNGVVEPGEDCDGAALGGASCGDSSCTGGAASCNADCTVNYDACTGCPICDDDGTCEEGENCTSCPGDCPSGAGASCGNGICEAGDGEDCLSCPQDCRGKQSGKPSNRYCCGDGAGTNPLPCSHSKCTTDSWQCTDTAAVPSCCGDATCNGSEDGYSCALDCGAPPVCGDGICNGSESMCSCSVDCGSAPASESSCNDGIDGDCDGAIDCEDSDCAATSACQCTAVGGSCSSAAECCTNKCKGKAGKQTCK